MQTRVSLSPESEGGAEAKYWATFSDVALAMLLVFILFILAQFLQYQKIFVLERIAERQGEVQAGMMGVSREFPSVDFTFPEGEEEDDYSQRIRVAGELVFLECRDDLTSEGRELLEAVGRVLSRFQDYFASVQVEGHADRQTPDGIVCARAGIEDNWQLSARRATEVVRVFSGAGAVPDPMLSSVGRGQYQPLSSATDTTAAAMRRDRRIELVLRYTEAGVLEELNAR